jgi:hypothetical protein
MNEEKNKLIEMNIIKLVLKNLKFLLTKKMIKIKYI